jgi:hypothetical protein
MEYMDEKTDDPVKYPGLPSDDVLLPPPQENQENGGSKPPYIPYIPEPVIDLLPDNTANKYDILGSRYNTNRVFLLLGGVAVFLFAITRR